MEYFQARSQEPNLRGRLKGFHQAMKFFEEITAIPEHERLSFSTVYFLAKKEILAADLSGCFEGSKAPSIASGNAGRDRLRSVSHSVLQNLRLVDFGPVLGDLKVH